jgi:hypothetical protein
LRQSDNGGNGFDRTGHSAVPSGRRAREQIKNICWVVKRFLLWRQRLATILLAGTARRRALLRRRRKAAWPSPARLAMDFDRTIRRPVQVDVRPRPLSTRGLISIADNHELSGASTACSRHREQRNHRCAERWIASASPRNDGPRPSWSEARQAQAIKRERRDAGCGGHGAATAAKYISTRTRKRRARPPHICSLPTVPLRRLLCGVGGLRSRRMRLLQLNQDQRPDIGEPEVAARLRRTDARFSRLLNICANALGESVQATRELSKRVSFLRDEIETDAAGRRQDGERRS